MADTPYTGESVPGEVMPVQEYAWDFTPIQQGVQDLTNLFASAQLKRSERAQKAREYWRDSMQDVPDVWEQDYEYVRSAVGEYNDLMKDFMNRGKDVSNLTREEYKQYKDAENKVIRYTKAAEDNQKWWTEASNQIERDSEGKYDPETFDAFKQGFLSPDVDPLSRAQFRNSNDAFIRDYDWDEILEYTVPKKTTDENGRIITSQFKPEDHKAYVEGLFAAGDPEILDMFYARKRDKDAAKKASMGDDFDPATDGYTQAQFVDETVGLGKSKYNYTKTEEEIKTSSSGNRNKTSGGGDNITVNDRAPVSGEGSNSIYYDSAYQPKAVKGANAIVNAVDVEGLGAVNDFSVDYFTKDSNGHVWAYGNYAGRRGRQNGWVDYEKFQGEFNKAKYPDMTQKFGGKKQENKIEFNGQ